MSNSLLFDVPVVLLLHVVPLTVPQIAADAAWSVTQGQGVTIAVIDGGARYTHDALQSSYRGTARDGSFDHDYNWIDYAYHNKEVISLPPCQCRAALVTGVSALMLVTMIPSLHRSLRISQLDSQKT